MKSFLRSAAGWRAAGSTQQTRRRQRQPHSKAFRAPRKILMRRSMSALWQRRLCSTSRRAGNNFRAAILLDEFIKAIVTDDYHKQLGFWILCVGTSGDFLISLLRPTRRAGVHR